MACGAAGIRHRAEVVLVDTEAPKAIDVFYVTAGGKKLEAEMQEKLGAEMRARIG